MTDIVFARLDLDAIPSEEWMALWNRGIVKMVTRPTCVNNQIAMTKALDKISSTVEVSHEMPELWSLLQK